MALIVTPGADDADAFVSLEACNTYCAARALTAWTDAPSSPADDKEAAIRRATAYLSNSFAWKGSKTDGRAQALAWPRAGVSDEEGWDIASDEIPTEIVQATCEIAVRELETPGFMTPAVTLSDRVKREEIGQIKVEYATVGQDPDASRPVLLLVKDMIGGLLATGSNALAGAAVRG